MTEMMRVMDAGGQAIKLSTAPKPRPGPNEVLVRVAASAVNPAEEKVFRGDFAGRFLHARTSPLVRGAN
jgi:NADPH:quinone reductase-like Zn-dependent oxidoreductase